MNDLKEKLETLKQNLEKGAFVDDLKRVRDWERALKLASLKQDLIRHDALKSILKELQYRINMCNQFLLGENEDEDPIKSKIIRIKIKERRDTYQWFVNIFDVAKANIDFIGKKVEEDLQHFN